jgi:predicted SAM-dependent methyltransferase
MYSALMSGGIKLHIGGQQPKAGWTILDVQPAAHVDHVGNCNDLSFLPDGSCDEIYASHVLEHLGYDGELQATIRQMYRVLKPRGRLRVSVPDLRTLCELFLDPTTPQHGQWHVMRLMFGGRTDPYDVHLCGLTFEFLQMLLTEAGFRLIHRVTEFGEFVDSSSTSVVGRLISVNVEAHK